MNTKPLNSNTVRSAVLAQSAGAAPMARAHILCGHQHWFVVAVDCENSDVFYGWVFGIGEDREGWFRFSELAQSVRPLRVVQYAESGLKVLNAPRIVEQALGFEPLALDTTKARMRTLGPVVQR